MLDRVLVPLKSNVPEQVVSVFKKIITVPGVIKLKYDATRPYLTVLRELSQEEISTPIEKILYQVFGAAESFEMILTGDTKTAFINLLAKVDQQNLRPSYILCNSKAALLSLLGITGSLQKTLFGIPMYNSDEIEHGTFLVFNTKDRDCQPEDTLSVFIVRYDV